MYWNNTAIDTIIIEEIEARRNELYVKETSSLKSIILIVLKTLLIIYIMGIRNPKTKGNEHIIYIYIMDNLLVE